MSAISLRLPNSIHNKVREVAQQEGTSINSFIATALAEKLSAFLTKEYLEKRAERSSEEKFQKALSEVPDIEPQDYDRL
ncbi:MAG: Arc family DNA-binding protein [Thermodesulfobacteriota bacterium]|nr:Arc family DNA-binding protein [Thermodesulfobacteriota bacterium]